MGWGVKQPGGGTATSECALGGNGDAQEERGDGAGDVRYFTTIGRSSYDHTSFGQSKIDRARDLIIHGPAHRGANGVAMPTDEDDQDGHFFYNHPERGAYFAA